MVQSTPSGIVPAVPRALGCSRATHAILCFLPLPQPLHTCIIPSAGAFLRILIHRSPASASRVSRRVCCAVVRFAAGVGDDVGSIWCDNAASRRTGVLHPPTFPQSPHASLHLNQFGVTGPLTRLARGFCTHGGFAGSRDSRVAVVRGRPRYSPSP